MPTDDSQITATATTPAQKYAALGGYTGPQFKPLEKVLGFICSIPKAGKTALIEGNPGAFIFNCDNSSTVNPRALATKWPMFGEDGTPTEILRWEAVDAKIKILENLARTNNPDRPQCVVFDSLSSMLELVIDYVTRNAQRLGLVGGDRAAPENFSALNGLAAWDMVYNTITQTINRLKNTGYGVWILGHITNKNVVLASDMITVPELTITDGFWKRLFPRFDFSGVIIAEKKTQMVDVPGKPKKRVDNVVRTLRIEHPGLNSILGARVPIEPSIELPLDGGWDRFEEAYKAAIRKAVIGVPADE